MVVSRQVMFLAQLGLVIKVGQIIWNIVMFSVQLTLLHHAVRSLLKSGEFVDFFLLSICRLYCFLYRTIWREEFWKEYYFLFGSFIYFNLTVRSYNMYRIFNYFKQFPLLVQDIVYEHLHQRENKFIDAKYLALFNMTCISRMYSAFSNIQLFITFIFLKATLSWS